MSSIITEIRDRPRNAGRITWRWVLIYLSAGAVLLEVIDVFSERFGLPDRLFILAAVGLVLLLPGVAGAGALRGLAREENEEPRQQGSGGSSTPRGPRSALDATPAPVNDSAPPNAEMAELHYRLGRFHEQRGDSARAAYHYAMSLEVGDVTPDP